MEDALDVAESGETPTEGGSFIKIDQFIKSRHENATNAKHIPSFAY